MKLPRLMKGDDVMDGGADGGSEEAADGGAPAAAAAASLALADADRRCFLLRRLPTPVPFSEPPDGVSVNVTLDVCPYLRRCNFKLK